MTAEKKPASERIHIEAHATHYSFSTKGRKRVVVLSATDGSEEADKIVLEAKAFPHIHPGNVYLLATTPDKKSFFLKDWKFVRNQDPDGELAAAAEIFLLAEKTEAVNKRLNVRAEALQPHIAALRRARGTLFNADKLPFDLWLLNEIRKVGDL